MTKMKRKGVVFNLGSPEEKELHDFCLQRSPTNFSGFVKKALFLYMKGRHSIEREIEPINHVLEKLEENESDLMSSII